MRARLYATAWFRNHLLSAFPQAERLLNLPTVLDLATEIKRKVTWRRPRPQNWAVEPQEQELEHVSTCISADSVRLLVATNVLLLIRICYKT
jgi:hypothetical protein